ncbi:hypothetical protein OEZ86_006976 [Tetradesmus obliquus]|nr:hypothetical protein OEZ86_006976 [Tetradesmus obliquus]
MACKDDHDGTGTLDSAVLKGYAQDIAYDSDEFRLFVAKIAICPRKAIHVWSECPYVHPGERARRRDPRLHHYSSQPCPDNSLALQKGGECPRGDACHYSHNLFETHLHPEMYRTTMCTAGSRCRRRLCFFAHNPQELRQPTPVQMAVQQQQQQQQQQQALAAADAPAASESSTPAAAAAAAAVEEADSAYAGSPTAGGASAAGTATAAAAAEGMGSSSCRPLTLQQLLLGAPRC